MESSGRRKITDILPDLLIQDKELCNAFTTLLLRGDKPDDKCIGNFLEMLYSKMAKTPKQISWLKKKYPRQLKALLHGKGMMGFIRILRMNRDIYESFGVNDNRLTSYIKSLKFTPSGDVDYRRTSLDLKNQFDFSRIRSFGKLNAKEKYLIRTLNKNQIDVLSNLSPKKIVILANVCNLELKQIIFTFTLTPQETKLYKKFGPEKFRFILQLDAASKGTLFNLSLGEIKKLRWNHAEQQRLLTRMNVDPSRTDLLESFDSFTNKEYELLQLMIKKFQLLSKNLRPDLIDLIFEMADSNAIERKQYFDLDANEREVLIHLDGEQLDVIESFAESNERIVLFREIFNLASILNEKQLDFILSLENNEIKYLASSESRDKLLKIVELKGESGSWLMELGDLSEEEKLVISELDADQRKALVKAYTLEKEGLDMMFDLTSVQFHDVLELAKRSQNLNDFFNLTQRVLLKKINNMKLSDKDRLLSLTENELKLLDGLRPNKSKMLNFSGIGLLVLEATSTLNEEQLGIISQLNNGDIFGVLEKNNQLKPETILDLNRLTNKEEAKVLMNLNLKQRNELRLLAESRELSGKLSGKLDAKLFSEDQRISLQSLSRPGHELLKNIIRLNGEEMMEVEKLTPELEELTRGLNEQERRVCGLLKGREMIELPHVLKPRIEDELFFKVFRLPNLSQRTLATKTEWVDRFTPIKLNEIKEYPISIRYNYLNLMASMFVTQLPETGRSRILEYVAQTIDKTLDPPSSSIFYLSAFKYSMRDDLGEENLLSMMEQIKKIPRDHANIARLFDFIGANEVSIFRKMLIDTVGRDIFHRLIQDTLSDLHGEEGAEDLQEIISIVDRYSSVEVLAALLRQVKDGGYYLARKYFFGGRSNERMVESLSTILQADDVFDFFNLKSANIAGTIPLEGRSLENPNILEYSLYYNADNVLQLLRKLSNWHVLNLLSKRPVVLLSLCVRNRRIQLLRFFSAQMGATQVTNIIWNNVEEFLTFSIDKSLESSSGYGSFIHSIANWLKDINPDMMLYRKLVAAYIIRIQYDVPTQVLGNILDLFVREDVTQQELIQEILARINPVDREWILKSATTGCGATRSKRELHIPCVDTRDEENHLEERTEESDLKRMLDDIKIHEDIMKLSLYDSLIQNVGSSEYESENPIITKLRYDIGKEKNINTYMERIEKSANAIGLLYTIFSVGKHIVHGNLEGIGYDTLNLWLMPKLGQKISEKIMSLQGKYDSQLVKSTSTIVGRAVGNFAAFLGLAKAIKARNNATDPIDKEIADLNIASNAIFIGADVPAVVTEIAEAAGLETGLLGTIAGPIGMGISVVVMIGTDFVESSLEVKKLSEKIQLTDQENSEFYWDFFLGNQLPKYITENVELKDVYGKYLPPIIKQYDNYYDKIGIGLPSLVVTREEYETDFRDRKKRHFPIDESAWYAFNRCTVETKVVDSYLNYTTKSIVKEPFHSQIKCTNRMIPDKIDNYTLVCAPSADKVQVDMLNVTLIESLPEPNCRTNYAYDRKRKYNRTVEEIYIPQSVDDNCQHVVLYEKSNSSNSKPMLFAVEQNLDMTLHNTDSIDVIFTGRAITVHDLGTMVDTEHPSRNTWYMQDDLDACEIHHEGVNFFYINGSRFNCELGIQLNGQTNTAVVKGEFEDTLNIHTILGSLQTDEIRVSYADYVDGRGGNDTIIVNNFTTVRAHFGDVVDGNGIVWLPLDFNEIVEINVDKWIMIHDDQDRFVQAGLDSSLKTADEYVVTPTRIDNDTFLVTHVHIKKIIETIVSLSDEISNLEKISNPNFNVVKQLTSSDYDLIICDHGDNVFHADVDDHNYYWESSDVANNLYIFNRINGNVTVSRANGIFNFESLNSTVNDTLITPEYGKLHLDIGRLHVTLLPNYKDIRVTYDGSNFHYLKYEKLVPDYCSHSLTIDSRFIVNGTDLIDHYNCFEFPSDRVLFFKRDEDLLISSGRQMLTIMDYYTELHRVRDLSIKLNHEIVEPDEFRKRADQPNSIKPFEIGDEGLIIWHNQPDLKRHVGYVDLRNQSVLDYTLKIVDHHLELLSPNNTLIKIINWSFFPTARELIFDFNDCTIDNSQCVLSNCNPDDILKEFQDQQERVVNHNEDLRSSSFPRIGSDEQSVSNTCFGLNIGLAYFLLHSFLDHYYPLPKFRSNTNQEVLANASNITDCFEKIVNETAKQLDIVLEPVDSYYSLYSDVVYLSKRRKYSEIPSYFTSFAKTIVPNNTVFQETLRNNVNKMFDDELLGMKKMI